MMAYNLSPKI